MVSQKWPLGGGVTPSSPRYLPMGGTEQGGPALRVGPHGWEPFGDHDGQDGAQALNPVVGVSTVCPHGGF